MATFSSQKPEEGRPPESSTIQKIWHNKINFNNKNDNNNFHTVEDINKNFNNNENNPTTKTEKIKQKLLCIKKPLSLSNIDKQIPITTTITTTTATTSAGKNNLITLNVSALSLNKNYCKYEESASKTQTPPPTTSTTTTASRKNRNSLHQNVEEALSSLLWQPYEYQNKSKCNNTATTSTITTTTTTSATANASSSPPLSTCSCCSSRSSVSSTFDLDETANNSPLERYVDLYLRHEMVNNLAGKNAVHQSYASPLSRDNNYSQLLSTSRLSCFVVDVATSSTKCIRRCNNNSGRKIVVENNDVENYDDDDGGDDDVDAASVSNNKIYCDVNNGSDMQLEVSGNVSCCAVPTTNNNNSTMSANGGGGGGNIVNISTNSTASSVVNGGGGTTSDALKTTVLSPYVLNTTIVPNLSSANVVGLPNHPRYGSVPSNITTTTTTQTRLHTGNNNIFPNHPRNGSEPSGTNQFRFTSTNNNAIVPISNTNHQRNDQFITTTHHMRSSSAPKSLPIQRYDNNVQSTTPSVVSTSSITTTTSSSTTNISRISSDINHKVPQSNVSNVNVNFYRAVPVNVVSSVPTIHCLNTLSSTEGNNISNVQIMPLGTNTPSHFLGHNNNITSNNSNNTHHNHTIQTSTTNIGTGGNAVLSNITTQVTVHSPVNQTTNSIQIPSNFPSPQINNNNSNVRGTTTINQTPTNCNSQIIIQNNQGIRTVTNDTRSNSNSTSTTTPRTFTSTEAQTDEIAISVVPQTELQTTANSVTSTREQRRRERRERRHQRRINNANNHRHTVDHGTQANTLQNDTLPDLLNNHLPPPYSAAVVSNVQQPQPPPPPPPMVPPQIIAPPPPPPHNGAVLQTVVPNSVVPSGFAPFPPASVLTGQVPLVQGATPVPVTVTPPSGFRFPFPAGGFRRGRFSEEPPKSCCGLLSWKPGSLRWFIALIALVAVCCVLVGTALGAMRPAGRDHLTVSLLMIGVGIVLVTVSGVAWRLTSHDSSTCRSMLGLGSTESVDVCSRRFVPRLPPSYGRPHHPYAAMMYPEFQYRPPPPSYQASMQEYRLRLLLLDRGNTPQIQAGIQNAISPPPTYRSHAGSLLRAPLSNRRDAALSEYSCPPSYRSQNSTANRQHNNHPLVHHHHHNHSSVLHSREQSLSISETNSGEGVVNVVNILGSAVDDDIALDNITLDSLKMEPDTNDINHTIRMLPKDSTTIDELEGTKDGNLVTIVQTSDQSPVIVTVSGSSHIDSPNNTVQVTDIPSEMEILAHL